MPRITRKLEFDAGHRVLGHEGKCRHLHGHRYVAEITCGSATLDSISRVVDFGVVKAKVGKWLDDNWDHNMLLNENDPLRNAVESGTWTNEAIFGGKMPYIIPHGENPTAEVMSRLLYEKARDLLNNEDLTVVAVRLYETPNCWADYVG